MSLPEIFKNKIKIDDNKDYYRGSARDIKENNTLPMKVKIKYNNRLFNTIIVNMTDNYYITKDGNVLYKKDTEIIEKNWLA